jgi:hypothetical protein
MISRILFTTLGVPIVAGRDFTVLDTRPVALINEAFARKCFAGRNPVGLHIGLVDDRYATPDALKLEVVGVVKDRNIRICATLLALRRISPTGKTKSFDL